MATGNTKKETGNMASTIKITVKFSESNLIAEGAEYDSFEAFQAALDLVATDAPKGGAYDKVYYRIVLSDINFDLEDRYDVHHTSHGNTPFCEGLAYQLRRAADNFAPGAKASKATLRAAAAYIESFAN